MSSAPLRWTLLHDAACGGAENMARDVALAHLVSEGVERGGGEPPPAFLRFYAWKRPTLSFGRNEPARERFDPTRLAAARVDVVRRPTGGRAVLHDREVTYAVVVPARALGGPRKSYRRIHRALAHGLTALGAEVELASADRPTELPGVGPCFERPAGGEVMARGRKLVGSAQARIGRALLQHGSILLHDDQSRIVELAAGPGGGTSAPDTRPATLAELFRSPPAVDCIVRALADAFREELPGVWSNAPAPSAPVFDAAGSGDAARFDDPEWVWRR